MKTITSHNTFKTCYIAQVKEELGLPVKRASNRKGKNRKVQIRQELKPFIKQAIIALKKQSGRVPFYREIQKKAFELYKSSVEKPKSDKFYGIFKPKNNAYMKQIAGDKEIYYE